MTTLPARPHAIPAELAELMAGPVVRGARCRGLSPEWDTTIPGEQATAREARIQLARRTCRRCPALARCIELLDELGSSARDVVIAGEVRDGNGRVIQRRWSLSDAVRPHEEQADQA